jgi:uncharacterized protein YbjQ (UPF0145 family)
MNLPLSYFGAPVGNSAGEGKNLLGVEGQVVRPAIGGKHSKYSKRSKRSKRSTRKKGGFYPSVMGNFISASSKYIVPMALFAGYKLMTKATKVMKGTKGAKSTKLAKKTAKARRV